jgi:hypothetical protein
MQNTIERNSLEFSLPLTIKPYSDSYITIKEKNDHFDDIEYLWNETDNNRIDRKAVVIMAASILDSFINMNFNPSFGYFPAIFVNEYGIHSGIFLDLDIQYIKKTDPSILFFDPEHVLSAISQ